MSLFSSQFNDLPLWELAEASAKGAVRGRTDLERFAGLLAPKTDAELEALCGESQRLTQQRFGKVIRFFAPLYLSNECVNNCKYCGFSRDNPILRVTLTVDEVVQEAKALKEQGFRHLLLVSGEHPKFASNNYIADCVEALRFEIPSLSLEVGPMEAEDYRTMVEAGAETLVVYQETYDREVYADVHTAGPKKHFDWRLDTAERAYESGFRRLGIGALYGLSDWRYEAIALAAHLLHLQKHCWKSQLTVSFPRLRPHAGDFDPLTEIRDRELVQLFTALRLVFPDVGIVLSTREPEALRDGLIPLGVTHMSAGSHTEPGGYTGAGSENLHLTKKGRVEALSATEAAELAASTPSGCTKATGQFDIADERSPEEMARLVKALGYEAVWKDWDAAVMGG